MGNFRIAFRIAHDNGAAVEIEVLDAQAQAFQQAQAGAVEQLGLELVDARHLRNHLARLVFREHLRQVLGRLGADGVDRVVKLLVEHRAIEEQERAEGLILRRRGNVTLDGEMGKKRLDFRAAHVFRVALAVVQDEAAYPIDVGLFGAKRVVLRADRVAHLIQQLLFGRLVRGFGHGSPLDSTEIVTYNSNAAKQHCRGNGDPPGGLGGKSASYTTALNGLYGHRPSNANP